MFFSSAETFMIKVKLCCTIQCDVSSGYLVEVSKNLIFQYHSTSTPNPFIPVTLVKKKKVH